MKSKLLIFAIVVVSILFMGYSHNPPTGRTGAPFDKKCTGCHSSSNPNNYNGTIELIGLPVNVEPSKTYPLVVKTTKTAGNPVGAAFQLAIVDSQNNTIGTLVKGAGTGTGTKNGRRYMENRDPKNFSGSSSVTWNFDWISPDVTTTAAQNGIKVYMTSLITNGNGKTSGDKTIYNIINSNMAAPCNLSLQATVTKNISCSGTCNGKVTLSLSNGQSPYTYLWANGTQNINQLCAGNYSVTVIDNVNCTANSQFTISDATPIEIGFGVLNKITCNLPSIQVCPTISGGSSPYQYSWPDGGNTSCNSIETAGNYQLTITDQKGCEKVKSFTIDDDLVNPMVTLTNTENILSIGGCLDLSFTSSESQITFMWDGPNGWTSTEMIPTICDPGLYNLAVTSTVNGCSISTSTEITQAECNLSATLNTDGSLNCTTSEVLVCASVTGGTAPFSYEWSTQGNSIGSNSCLMVQSSGHYILVVTDNVNCSITTEIDITENLEKPTALIAGNLEISPNGCTILDGSTSTPASQLSYEWISTTGPIGNENMMTICDAGTYTLVVTNMNTGCTNSTSVDVSISCDLQVQLSDITLTCDLPSANICASSAVSGGTAPFTYQWNKNNTSFTAEDCFSSEIAETFSLLVTDANNCTATGIINISIDQTNPDVSISGNLGLGADGCTTLNGSSSIPSTELNYEWSSSNGSLGNEKNITVCEEGTYTLRIINKVTGCSNSANIEVVKSCDLQLAQLSDIVLTCNQSSATICASSATSGGTPPFSYQWNLNGAAFSSQDCITTQTAGTFTLTATDANGCVAAEAINIIENKTIPTISIEGNLELGADGCTTLIGQSSTTVEYLWEDSNGNNLESSSNLTICSSGVYQLTVVNTENGCSTSTSVEVTEKIPCDIQIEIPTETLNCVTSQVEICPTITNGTTPFIYMWSGPNEFISDTECIKVTEPGNYSLSVTDNEGCTSTETVTVEKNIHELNVMTNTTDVSCFGSDCDGKVSIEIEGGIAPYSYSFSSGFNIGSGLCAGEYAVTITDAEGCSTYSNFVIQDATPIVITDVQKYILDCNLTEIEICPEVSGGNSPYQYVWNDGSTQSCRTITEATNWDLTITDSNGCISTKSGGIDANITVPSLEFSQNIYSIKSGDCTNLGFTTPGTDYSIEWQGPNNFSSTEDSPEVCEAGEYTLVITNLDNGCTNSGTITVEVSTSNTNLDYNSIEITPNPTSDFIEINFSNKIQGTILMFSLHGQQLHQETISDKTMSLDLTDYSNGLYFLKIESEDGIYYEKILKQ